MHTSEEWTTLFQQMSLEINININVLTLCANMLSSQFIAEEADKV